ncbi:uncharacterized transmembrane protein DDB_G0289901-like isoform X1 [Aphis gossypii]|nr:uncharacterized transmembrane protein DDB_G0289901-like isoform X1 [Aphis gossypii]
MDEPITTCLSITAVKGITIDHVMPSYDDQTTDPTAGQRDCGSYMSCNLMMYEDGGGGGGGGSGSSSSGDDSNFSGNGGSDFYEDSGSWSEDGISCVDANTSLCGSADEGCYSGKSSSIRGGDGSSSNGSNSDCGGGGINRGKWLKSLRTVIDRMVGTESKGRGQKRAVKTILRPPTTYKYVIGMSGFPSKVPVYPKTNM